MNYNKVIYGGHLTRDPDVRTTANGNSVCNFTVASSTKWAKGERTVFLDCVAWGKTGETIAKHFSKGKPILVDGDLVQDTWEDRDTGQKRSKIRLNVQNFTFVGGGGGKPSGKAAPAPVEDPEIPF